MTSHFIPIDQDQRLRITSSLDENLFVEAGAGTGKTEALVRRIVALITEGITDIEAIAAITFTELAAGELRERVRARLIAIADNIDICETHRVRSRRAIRRFDSASIQTLHSFAGQLLRDRPLNVGLPPSFDVMESIESDINFQTRWRLWLDEILDSEDRARPMVKAMSLGLRVDQLRDIAVSLYHNFDSLPIAFPRISPPESHVIRDIVDSKQAIKDLLPLAHNDDDRLLSHAKKVISFADRLERIGTEDDMALAVLSRHGRLSNRLGRIQDWDNDLKTGINGCTALKSLLTDLESAKNSELDQWRSSLLCTLLEDLRDLAIKYFHERVSAGKIEFQDLLVLARNLLRDHLEVREHFRSKFTHILIDEFQDTDPVQSEIAVLLSTSGSDLEGNPIDLISGKLFAVGDPKQSIYMFRGADISVSEHLKNVIPDGQLALSQNFRSQSPIISWLNPTFEKWMGGDGDSDAQIEYHSISPMWDSVWEQNPMGVKFIGGALTESSGLVRQIESQALANAIIQIKEEKWMVRDGATSLREADYRDICVLLPTRTGLDVLETALTEANIPYRLESQSMVLGTQDVQDLLNCLRAIDTPSDQIALVAALRSSVFGCSDLELFDFSQSGAELNYLSGVRGVGPVQDALDLLKQFHEDRLWLSPESLIENFVRQTRTIESCFALTRPRERWRRLRFVIDRAAAFAQASNSSLRSYLDWMERQTAEGARMVETPVPEPDEDSVRIMTIHASKGLEFPIVILAGIGGQPRINLGPVIFDRVGKNAEVDIPAPGGSRFRTPGYSTAELEEKRKQDAERIRLMYVASTRAEDHLVLSLFRSEPRGEGSSFASDLEKLTGRDSDLWSEFIINTTSINTTYDKDEISNADNVLEGDEDARINWIEERKSIIKRGAVAVSVSATSLAQIDKEESYQEEIAYRIGRGGTNLGRAVHSVLQSLNLEDTSGIEQICRSHANAEGIPSRWLEVLRLAQVALDSSIVHEAIASHGYYREVYVGASVGSKVLEGFVDLVFETEDGLVVVDYKTDPVTSSEEAAYLMDRYRIQGGSYALALSEATGKPITKVVFLFLHSAEEIVMNDLPDAIENVRGKVEIISP
tara:strand:- start:184 stop:3486 length:3303 start_codon:yes stop_codon:yes gene_type:complete